MHNYNEIFLFGSFLVTLLVLPYILFAIYFEFQRSWNCVCKCCSYKKHDKWNEFECHLANIGCKREKYLNHHPTDQSFTYDIYRGNPTNRVANGTNNIGDNDDGIELKFADDDDNRVKGTNEPVITGDTPSSSSMRDLRGRKVGRTLV